MYMYASKLSMILCIALFFCLTTSFSLGTNIWLSKWTDQAKVNGTGNHTSSNAQIQNMIIYAALGITQGIAVDSVLFFIHLVLQVFSYLPCS